MKTLTALALVLAATGYAGCTRDLQASDAQQIERQYGLSGASAGTITTPDGPVKGTLVPITLADGRQGQLFIPQKQANDPHAVYLRDQQGLHPLQVRTNTTRDEVVRAPAIVETQPSERRPAKKRSWEKDALIIGGSAGAGTAIGAVAGGKKGAAVGAAAGGVGGLIFDLITRHKQ